MKTVKASELKLWSPEPEIVQASPEARIVLAIVLQGISEQDPLNVTIPHPPAGTPLPTIGQMRVAAEARNFCNSREYRRLCRLVRFDPERRSRPDLAKTALELLGHLRGSAISRSPELLERRCDVLEKQQLHATPAPELEEINIRISPLPEQTPKSGLRKIGHATDYSDATIGYLKVLGRVAGTLTWQCRCTSCGQRTVASSEYLRTAKEASCLACAAHRKSVRRSMAAVEADGIPA
jgi:hypothetical protein